MCYTTFEVKNMAKTVLVTGSAKGIGRACITLFAQNGYNVIINYNNSENEAKLLEEEIRNKYNVDVLAIKCDITNVSEIENMTNIIIDRFGKIDVLINNAAYACDNYIDDKTKDEFMKVLECNVVGTFLVTKYLYKYMDGGTIVNISSTDAVDTYNEISIDYCASKAAVNSLTKTLSLAIKNNKVIGVMPNWVKTESVMEMNSDFLNSELERIGQSRLDEPDNVARKIFNIVNDDKIISGSIIRIDGDVMC